MKNKNLFVKIKLHVFANKNLPDFYSTLDVNICMRKIILLSTVLLLTISFCYSQPENKLAAAFVQSIAKNNFKLLDPYLMDLATAKSLYPNEFKKMTPAKQAAAIAGSRNQMMTKWKKVVENAKQNKIDFNKLTIKQVLSSPLEFPQMNSLLVTYEYKGVEWDDLLLIVSKKGTANYIVELPTNTAMFALNEDGNGKNLKNIQLQKDKNDPELKKHLADAVEKIKKTLSLNDDQLLYAHIVYSGEEDKDNRWKRAVDPGKAEDVESARIIKEKLKNSLLKCDKINYGDVRVEKESEGIWYVINATCGNSKHTFAFLKIKDVFVLGDMD